MFKRKAFILRTFGFKESKKATLSLIKRMDKTWIDSLFISYTTQD